MCVWCVSVNVCVVCVCASVNVCVVCMCASVNVCVVCVCECECVSGHSRAPLTELASRH